MNNVALSPANAAQLWPIVSEMLEPALVSGMSALTLEDIYTALMNTEMQLWASFDDGHVVVVMVTQVVTKPKHICHLMFAAGIASNNWGPLYTTIKEWAKSEGCHSLVTGIRRALVKKYEPILGRQTHVVFENQLLN